MPITTDKNEHAIANARGWFETIKGQVADYNSAAHMRDGRAADERREKAEQAIVEGPLSVQVRSGWHAPGADDDGAVEYEILLTTGGPALRIIGDLDGYGQASSARLEWQDWGTSWTFAAGIADEATLLSYVSHFYFGE